MVIWNVSLCVSCFSFLFVKIDDRGNLGRKALLWYTVWGYSPSWQEGMGTGSWGTWSRDNSNQDIKRDERWCSLNSLSSVCSEQNPTHGVRVRSSHLSQPSRELLHRHAQSSVSLMILEPAKFAINTNDHVIVVIFISIVSISDLTFLLDFTGLNVFSW